MHLQLDRPGRKYFPMVAQRPSFDEQTIQKMTEDLGTNHRVAKNLWTRQSVKGMVDRVLPEMRDDDQQRLMALHDVGYLLSSLFVHQSPASLGTAIRPQFPEATVLSRRPSTTLVREALSMAYFSVALIARLVALGAQAERLDRILAEDGPLFEYLSPDASDKAGRNDACPCGSGQKFKRCHGRLS